MPTIAIVGAGPGLGLSLARRFGSEVREAFEPVLMEPDLIAATYWDMSTARDRVEEVVGNVDLVEQIFP